MKLQKQLSRRVGSKDYAKYVAVIPPKVIEEVNWKEGDELEIQINGKKVVISQK